jgi:hyaluronoglucosaminidase
MDAPSFQIRGVVEGFYGVYYTFPERNDLIRFVGRHGFNSYVYGPKNDRQHRSRWWEPYPDEIMAQFGETVAVARAAGVAFCYAIAPITYAGGDDLYRVAAKLRAFFDIGVRSFSVLMDDIMPSSDSDPDGRGYQHYADLHADICNRLYAMLQGLDSESTLSMCPIDYHGAAPFSNYLRALGATLDPAIDVFYSGAEICSPSITAQDARDFAEVARRPPLIWDNYPANDLAMRAELHVGPLRGRDPLLGGAVRGLAANLMNQPEASKIALATLAEYFRDPAGYDPAAAWGRALAEAGGPASQSQLRLFAETSLRSCLEMADAPRLEGLVAGVIGLVEANDLGAAVGAAQPLGEYLSGLDEACYHLKNRMANLRLREDLIPWIEALEDWIWLGKRSVQALAALDRGEPTARLLHWIDESLKEIQAHNKRSGGRALLPLAQYVRERIA